MRGCTRGDSRGAARGSVARTSSYPAVQPVRTRRTARDHPSNPRDSNLAPEGGHDLALVEPEEAGLVRSDLVDMDVVVPGLVPGPDRREVALRVRTAGDHLGDRVLVDHGDRLLEVGRCRQLHVEGALERDRRAEPMSRSPRFGLVLGPADVHLEV